MIDGATITPGVIAMWICVIIGAVVLNQFTRLGGFMGFLVNAVVLLGGASLANWLTQGLSLPMNSLIDQTLLMSFAGMVVSSLLMIVVFYGRWKS